MSKGRKSNLVIEAIVRNRWGISSPDQIALEAKVSRSTVHNYAVRLKLDRMSQGEVRGYFNANVNKDFFKVWTPEMAYILGYIWADGTISGTLIKPKALGFDCVYEDSYLLENIRTVMGSKHALSDIPAKVDSKGVNHRRKRSLSISNHHLVKDLINLGLRPRKSYLDLEFPEIPEIHLEHFCRGYLDGDGCVGESQSGYNVGRVSLHFLGTEKFIRGMQESICAVLGVSRNKVSRKTNSNCFIFGWSALEDLRKIYSWLYGDLGNLFLVRKKNLLQSYLGERTDTNSSV